MTRADVESSLQADGHIEYRGEKAFYNSYAEGYMDCFDLFQAKKKLKKESRVCDNCRIYNNCIILKIGHNYNKMTYCSKWEQK